MKSTKLVGLSGIVRKIRVFKKRGKSRLEEISGVKCNKLKMQCEHSKPKMATALLLHLAVVSSNGMTEGGSGEVVYGVGFAWKPRFGH